ncbi:hypothetical protein CCACVL1_19827 [Corchorus capsularis]|uniref:Uncharacterized protein n=1 Tax=Corchorus capsularis TaxID=210143 RepID=A0A1R3HEM5_COCAP|nr:hypothetical protein CCACVL1_19827 [Corchorus capsularis]
MDERQTKRKRKTLPEKIQLAKNPKIVILDPDYPKVLTLICDPNRSSFYEETIGWWIQKEDLPKNLKMILHLKCYCGAKGSVLWYKSGVYRYPLNEIMSSEKQKFVYFATLCKCGSCVSYCGIEIGEGGFKRLNIQRGKTIPLAVNPATINLTSSHADHPAFNFTVSDLALFRDSYHLKLILLHENPSKYKGKFPESPNPNPKAIFKDSDYPTVIPLCELAVDRSGFHEKTIGWWIQKEDLPEDELKMIVHLECKCGAKGYVYWYDEGFSYTKDDLIAVLSRKSVYFGTRCSCASDITWCGIVRGAANKKKEKKAGRKSFSITPKILPSALHPAFNFSATDPGLFQHFYFYNLVMLLEGKVDRSDYDKQIVDPECSFCNIDFSFLPHPNPKAVFKCLDYPTVIALSRLSPDRSEFHNETIGWWIEKEGFPRDDLKMIVHLKCICGAYGCVGCYNDGGFSWTKDRISAVLSRKVSYFATSCMCGSHTTHCGITLDKSIDELICLVDEVA